MVETLKTVVSVDGAVRVVHVKSSTRENVKHRVLLACSCEGFKFGQYCKHIAEAGQIAQVQNAALRKLDGKYIPLG